MKPFRSHDRDHAAFTLVELLTAMAVLTLLMVLVGTLLAGASKVTKLSNQRLDADSEARLVFDRMATDFTLMLRRSDVDFHFVKQAGSDTFFFFSEVGGYFPASVTVPQSNTTLVGYRINSSYQLERLARGLSWDSDGTTSGVPIVFLTFNSAPTDFTPDPNSTIVGKWSGIDQPSYVDTNFHVLGDSVFRLEFCFLLKDGTYSTLPAITSAVSSNNLAASAAPKSSNSSPAYAVGSRWYDTTHFCGYICTNSSAQTAVWKPLGMSDVQAIVVSIAILDQAAQKLVSANATALPNLATPLTDPTATDLSTQPPKLMAETWQAAVTSPNYATAAGVPNVVASQVRIYQRLFYLNNLSQ